MPKKPICFNDTAGHKNLVKFLKDHLAKDTLPQFVILEGGEGLSRSSLAKILTSEIMGRDPQVLQRAINENKGTGSILLYNVSINGGKNTVKEVEASLGLGLFGLDKKVIILDRAHDMNGAAQEAFPVSTEYLPKDVYLLVYTTGSLSLKATLKSRAFMLHLQYLTQTEMVSLLTSYVHDRNLQIQTGASIVQMIAVWADGKPRIVLSLIEGFAPGSVISTAMVKESIDYLNAEDILPLLTCLSDSMTRGLPVISETKVNNNLVPLMTEVLKVKNGMTLFKLSPSDTHKVRAQLNGVNVNTLMQFIYRVAVLPKLSCTDLILAFLQSHTDSSFPSSLSGRTETLQVEMQQKMKASKQELAGAARSQAPSIQNLLQRGVVLGG